jgi:hypothetical protein
VKTLQQQGFRSRNNRADYSNHNGRRRTPLSKDNFRVHVLGSYSIVEKYVVLYCPLGILTVSISGAIFAVIGGPIGFFTWLLWCFRATKLLWEEYPESLSLSGTVGLSCEEVVWDWYIESPILWYAVTYQYEYYGTTWMRKSHSIKIRKWTPSDLEPGHTILPLAMVPNRPSSSALPAEIIGKVKPKCFLDLLMPQEVELFLHKGAACEPKYGWIGGWFHFGWNFQMALFWMVGGGIHLMLIMAIVWCMCSVCLCPIGTNVNSATTFWLEGKPTGPSHLPILLGR